MMPAMTLLLPLLAILLGPVAQAQGGVPPLVDDADRAAAARIGAMPDGDPVSRLLMLLEARSLDEGGLFALAERHPDIVEQAVVARYKRAVTWLLAMPDADLHRVRRGEQVIRVRELWNEREQEQAESLGTSFGFKEKKLLAVRAGPYEGRVYRVVIDSKGKGQTTDRGTVELCWPPTPERDETSRDTLAKHFGARPSRMDQGSGSLLPLEDGSFEADGTLGTTWSLEDAIVLSGVRSPVNDVEIDGGTYLDGRRALRIYNSAETRLFQAATQRVEIVPGMRIRARTHHKTENVRAEYQQNESDLYLSMTFEDIFKNPVEPPIIARGRIATHTWEPLEVTGTAPMDAAYVRIALVAGLSGTTWFDGTSLTLE